MPPPGLEPAIFGYPFTYFSYLDAPLRVSLLLPFEMMHTIISSRIASVAF